jgi:hypothetical protein
MAPRCRFAGEPQRVIGASPDGPGDELGMRAARLRSTGDQDSGPDSVRGGLGGIGVASFGQGRERRRELAHSDDQLQGALAAEHPGLRQRHGRRGGGEERLMMASKVCAIYQASPAATGVCTTLQPASATRRRAPRAPEDSDAPIRPAGSFADGRPTTPSSSRQMEPQRNLGWLSWWPASRSAPRSAPDRRRVPLD